MRCRIELFGGVRIVQHGTTISRFQTLRTAALLGYLTLHAGQNIPREYLAEILWPEGEPDAIRNRLNQAVSSLRRQIEPPGVVPESILKSDRLAVRIVADAIVTDVADFQQAVQIARTSEDRAEREAASRQAIELYQGELMAGLYDDWLGPERLARHEEFADALMIRSRALAGLGHNDEAITVAQRLLGLDATDESVHQLLMQLYIRAGKPAAARRQFTELERVLAEFGDEPSDKSLALRQRARLAASGEGDPQRPRPVAVQPRTHAPITDLPPPPAPLTTFFGRYAEIARLLDWLGAPEPRLITISGLGGFGKTRLAIEAARRLGSVAWVDLSDLPAGADLTPEIARQLAILSDGGPDATGPIAQRLANCRALFLDNWSGGESWVATIRGIQATHGSMHLVVSSRQPLHVSGESILQLEPLGVPAVAREPSLEELLANESVGLFVSRAQQVRPDFQLSARNAEAVADLAQRLEGIPLAIELAASWVRHLSPVQIAERLASRFDMLQHRRKDIADRHRTLRTVFDAAWSELSPAARRALARVSVIPGEFSLDLVTAVAETDGLAWVGEWQDAGFVSARETSMGEVRYSMLDTVREYASLHLSPHEHDQAMATLSATVVDALGPRRRPSFAVRWERARDVWPSVEPVLDWLRHNDLESASRLAVAAAEFWEQRSDLAKGRTWLESLPDPPEDAAGRHLALARLAWLAGDYEAFASHLAEAAVRSDGGGPELDLLAAREAHRQGDFAGTQVHLESARSRLQNEPDPELEVQWHWRMGNWLVETGANDEARREYLTALSGARDVGHPLFEAACLLNLGHLDLLQDRPDSAEQLLNDARAKADEYGSISISAVLLPIQARLVRRRGDLPAARHLLQQCIAIAPDRPDLHLECLRELAIHAVQMGDDRLAATLAGVISTATTRALMKPNREQTDFESAIESLKGRMDSDLAAELNDRGRAMTMRDAWRWALQQIGEAGPGR